ncbi:MAG: lipocalin-like domain-containing protein [Pseudomonadota bacterium]
MTRRWFIALTVVCVVSCGRPAEDEGGLAVEGVLGGQAQPGFARADRSRAFRFPADHRAHPGFQNEWWYIVGNLVDPEGQAFGYQITWFRNQLAPEPPASRSDFATNAVWMGHAALTDVDADAHHHATRFSRGAAGLAGQFDAPFTVAIGDWSLVSGPGDGGFPWRLRAAGDSFSIDVTVAPDKPLVLNGEAGLSHKGGAVGNASYYYSATRLRTSGSVTVDGRRVSVTGSSWLDREWSTSALADGTVGWDWFSLQLDSGSDLMLYQLRESGGTAHPASSGTVTDAHGQARHLSASDFELEPLRHWRAPDGRAYPVAWRVSVPSLKIDAEVVARVDAQWMDTLVVYWEGAVEVRDRGGSRVGLGYLEMTGY